MKIYIFGNPLIREDRLPLEIAPELKKTFPEIQFEIVDPNENFPPGDEKDLLIIDSIAGLNRVKAFGLEDLQKIKKSPVSPHDYDLGMHLLLLKKLKKINSVKIIGLPSWYDRDKMHKLIKQVNDLISLEIRKR